MTFALLGCGSIAPTHARALAALPSEARLTHCCDIDPDRMKRLAEQFGLQPATWGEVLGNASIEAVTLCTPSGMHAAQAIEALEAGKHVILEKPMDVTVEACDRLLAAAAASDRRVGVISQHRFDPASVVARGVLDRGELGPLIAVDVRVPWYRTQQYYDSGDWRGTWEMDGGGCLMNQGIHTVDLMLWLAGPVERVYARARTAAHRGIEVEDLVCATIEFENGAIGSLTASTAMYPGFPARLGLHGVKGSLIIEGDALHTLAIEGKATVTGKVATAHARQVASGGTRAATEEVDKAAVAPAEEWAWGDAHRTQLDDFIRACREGRAPAIGGPEGRAAVAFIGACYRSAREDRPVGLA